MTREEVIRILEDSHVMLKGHFLLTSGKHSDTYMQCAQLFQSPQYSEILSRELADRFREDNVDLVVGPAIGGIILAYEVGRQLGVRNIFAERENGKMTFRRGFEVQPGQRVLIVEDVVTTGGSVAEVMELVRESGGNVVGVGVIVDRSAGGVDFGVRMESVISMEILAYAPDACPVCATGQPLVKPGSRKLK